MYQVLDCVRDPVPYPVVVRNKKVSSVPITVNGTVESGEEVSGEVESEEVSGEENNEDKVLTYSGSYTTYRRLIVGLMLYVEKYLFATKHEIKKRRLGNDVIITIRIKDVVDKMMGFEKVMVPSGAYTTYMNLVGGVIAYAEKYLFAVDHEIDKRIVGNDVVIKIRIKDVADKIMRRRRK